MDSSTLNTEIQRIIEKISDSVANKKVLDYKPDPFHPPELIMIRAKKEAADQLLNFFIKILNGFNETEIGLNSLLENDPEIVSTECLLEFKDFGSKLSYLSEHLNEKKSPRAICQITPKLMQAIERAASESYLNARYEASASIYEFLYFLEPGQAAYCIGVGNSYYFMGEYDKALRAYENGLKLDQQTLECYFFAARCQHKLGRPDEAIALMDQALELIHLESKWAPLEKQAEDLRALIAS